MPGGFLAVVLVAFVVLVVLLRTALTQKKLEEDCTEFGLGNVYACMEEKQDFCCCFYWFCPFPSNMVLCDHFFVTCSVGSFFSPRSVGPVFRDLFFVTSSL